MKEIHIILKTRKKLTITFERNDKIIDDFNDMRNVRRSISKKRKGIYNILKHQRIPESKLDICKIIPILYIFNLHVK